MKYRFKNKEAGYDEEVSDASMFVWSILFGPLYFASKGAWLWAFVAFGLAFATVGVSHLLFPFFARSIVFAALRRNGYEPDNSAVGKEEAES